MYAACAPCSMHSTDAGACAELECRADSTSPAAGCAQILQGVKQALVSAGTWAAQAALVEPAIMQKCVSVYQL